MLKELTRHHGVRHPFAVGVAALIVGPLWLAAALLYAMAYVIWTLFKLIGTKQ